MTRTKRFLRYLAAWVKFGDIKALRSGNQPQHIVEIGTAEGHKPLPALTVDYLIYNYLT